MGICFADTPWKKAEGNDEREAPSSSHIIPSLTNLSSGSFGKEFGNTEMKREMETITIKSKWNPPHIHYFLMLLFQFFFFLSRKIGKVGDH